MAGMLPDWMQGMQPAAPHGDPFMDYMRAQQPVDPYAMPTGSYADTPAPGMMGAPGESIQPGPPLVPMAPRPGVAPELDGPPPIPGQPAPPSWMPPGTSGQRELGATPEWLRTGQGKGAPANDAAPAAKPSGMPWETPPTGTYQQRNRAITTAMQESKGREGQLEAQGQEAEAIARENAAKSRALADADDLKSYEAATAKAGRDRAQLDVEIKQLSEGKIDPQRFWNDAGTGAKIGMAVSAIIGGILAPNYGGRNTGVEMIEGIIKRDMAAQESDRSNKQWALGQRRSSIGENLGDAGDLASRQAQARAAAYGVAIDQATAMRSRMTAPVAIERANQAIIGLEAGYVDAVSQYEAGQQAAELAAMKARGGGARAPKPEKPFDQMDPRYITGVEDDDGKPVMYRGNEADAQKFNARKNAAEGVVTMAREYAAKVAEIEKRGLAFDNWLSTSEGVAWAKTFSEQSMTKVAVGNGQGAVGDNEAERAKVTWGDPASWRAGNAAVIRESMDALARSAEIGIGVEFNNQTSLGLGDRSRVWRYNPATGKWYQPPRGKAGGVSREAAVGSVGGGVRETKRGMDDTIEAGRSGKLGWFKDSTGTVDYYDTRSPDVAADIKSGRLVPATPEESKPLIDAAREEVNSRSAPETDEEFRKRRDSLRRATGGVL